jgi:hypothetical protein
LIDIVRKKVCKKIHITGSQSGGVAASNTNIFVGSKGSIHVLDHQGHSVGKIKTKKRSLTGTNVISHGFSTILMDPIDFIVSHGSMDSNLKVEYFAFSVKVAIFSSISDRSVFKVRMLVVSRHQMSSFIHAGDIKTNSRHGGAICLSGITVIDNDMIVLCDS